MKTRAAVAFEAGKPLEICDVDLQGPKAGEVMVEIKATLIIGSGFSYKEWFFGALPMGLSNIWNQRQHSAWAARALLDFKRSGYENTACSRELI